MARFVKEIGTGLKGSGIARGPRIQVTAVMTPIRAMVTRESLEDFWDTVFSIGKILLFLCICL
jgi:hypothetical protein